MIRNLKRHGYIIGSEVAERDGLDLILFETEQPAPRTPRFCVARAPAGATSADAIIDWLNFNTLEDLAKELEVKLDDAGRLNVQYVHPQIGYAPF